jgi:glycosyltransferase involved in cell wall biosynthesis
MILSTGLDTNGQNTRYVRASERWGEDPSVLKALALGNTDPAGVVARFQVAADKFGGLKIRSAHKRPYEYMQFPVDLEWTPKTHAEVYRLAQEADVIHLNNSERAAVQLRLKKPMLLHHHGTLFRSNPLRMLNIARRFQMVQAVSTIDLLKPAPDVLHWLPSAYNVDGLLRYGEQHRRKPDGRIRIVHAPTDREKKHSDLFIGIVDELIAEGLPIDLVLVEQKTWYYCLAQKAQADIVYDQLTFGYGCNSIEAWAMGVPVISGADPWTLKAMEQEYGGAIPFYQATEKTLKANLRKLVKSADLRAEWAQKGMDHVRKYHDERPALAKLAELYALAIAGHVRRRIPMPGVPPVVFRNPANRKLILEGEPITFTDGVLSTNDPFVIQFVRRMMSVHRVWGITEDSITEDVA